MDSNDNAGGSSYIKMNIKMFSLFGLILMVMVKVLVLVLVLVLVMIVRMMVVKRMNMKMFSLFGRPPIFTR